MTQNEETSWREFEHEARILACMVRQIFAAPVMDCRRLTPLFELTAGLCDPLRQRFFSWTEPDYVLHDNTTPATAGGGPEIS
jgi:hypothetical protein